MSSLFGDPRLPKRFWDKVHLAPSGCWIWLSALTHNGYGQFYYSRSTKVAHAIAFKVLIGPYPPTLQMDHLCRVRRCVNPVHLEPVSHALNTLRGQSFSAVNARKTRCPQGHPYADHGYLNPAGHRRCRTCDRNRVHEAACAVHASLGR
jgi:hypothetical protein